MDPNQPPYGQQGQPPYGQYGQPPYGQPPYSQYGQPPHGQPPYGQYGQPPYGQPPQWDPYHGGFAPKPGSIPLRPLTVGDILGGAFTAMNRNRLVVFSLAAGFGLVQAVISVLLRLKTENTRNLIDNSDPNHPVFHWSRLASTISVAFGGSLVSVVVATVLTGMLIVIVTEDVVGRRAGFDLVWRKVRSRIVRLVVLSVVLSVLQVLGLLFCFAPGIWLWGIWAVAVPALMIENCSITTAMSRSQSLVSGTFWRVWGIRALGYLIATVLAGVIGAVFGGLTLASGGSQSISFGTNGATTTGSLSALAVVVLIVGGTLASMVTAPYKAAIDSLLYVDLRMRKEGLAADLQRAAAQR